MTRHSKAILLLIVLLTSIPTLALTASAPLFIVEKVRSDLQEGLYHIDATFHLKFSDEMTEALRNGVPLVVAVQIELLKPRRFWWDETVLQLEQRYALRFHALTQQYVLTDLNTEMQQSFHSLPAAVDFLNQRTTLPTLAAHLLEQTGNHQARLRIHLVPEALPLALKVRAFSQRAWRASSPWVVWRIE